VYEGFRLNLGKGSEMITFGSLLTNFELSNMFWSAEAVVNECSSVKPNDPIKLGLSKSQKHKVRALLRYVIQILFCHEHLYESD